MSLNLLNRLRGMVLRGRVRRTQASTVPRSTQVELPGGRLLDRVHVLQQAGFSSRPRAGAEALVVCVAADRDHPIVVATVDRGAPGPQLEEGEVALFTPGGTTLRLHDDGRVVIEGDLEVSGEIRDSAGTLGALRDAYDQHTHSHPQGPTGPPDPTSGGS